MLIDQPDRDLFHNGGSMFFHPEDGFLYLSLGDEGMGYDNAQRIDKNLFSGVIRIDVDRKGGAISHPLPRQPSTGRTAHYYIPNDNPWVGVAGALEEFWCIGLRNPHRMSYDPVEKTVYVGDVGHRSREEIDVIVKGGNYQWNFREGSLTVGTSRPATILGIEQRPLYQYGRDQGTAVIGGFVYRGQKHAQALVGKYIFGDWNGRVWALTRSGTGAPEVIPICEIPLNPGTAYGTGLSSFGVDSLGELYLCVIGKTGKIYKLEAAPPTGMSPPSYLSQTGVFRNLRTLQPAPGLVPYEVNAPLWSDGAEKHRWIALPNDGPPYNDDTRIQFSPTERWRFPKGTVFVKHFEIATDVFRPGTTRRLETRFFVCDSDGGAYGITYRWRDDQSDADLINDAQETVVLIRTSDGVREQRWTFPSQRDCRACHTAAAGFLLGVNTRQLNRRVTYSYEGKPVTENQLKCFERAGLLADFDSRTDTERLPKLAELGDEHAGIGHRVRSYLDANCSHCHRPNGVRAAFDARFETPLERQHLIGGWVISTEGWRGGELVRRGDPDNSLLLLAMRSVDATTRMPPISRNVPDAHAIQTIRAWIAGLAKGAPDFPVYLSDLYYEVVTNGRGPAERDRSNGQEAGADGRPIRLGGRSYAKGLGVHALSEIRIDLAGAFSLFLADVGVDDEVGEKGSVTFQVWADGDKLHETPRMTGASPTRSIRLDVSKRDELRLIVTDGRDGHREDHADWADARLVPRSGATHAEISGEYKRSNGESRSRTDASRNYSD